MRAPPPVSAAAAAASNVGATRADDVFYPSSDGRPMADDMWQGTALRSAAGDLEAVRPTALVAWAILVYPEEGNNKNRIASDVLVGLGLGTHNRSSYFVWEEGKPPDWVLEVASPRKQAEDRGYKRRYYAEMGVPEYWMFDPKGDLYPPGIPRLQGLKLVDGEYRPLESRVVDGEWTIRSEVLGLDIRVDGELLRFRDVATGRDVLRRSEVEAAIERYQAATRRHRAATERHRAATERALADAERHRAATERARSRREALRKAAEVRAEQEKARAEQEATLRSAAEARIAELEAALRRSRAGHPAE